MKVKLIRVICLILTPLLTSLVYSCSTPALQRNIASPDENVEYIMPDPELKIPKMKFHNGEVANGSVQFFSELPNIPQSPTSAWYLTQWRRPTPITPVLILDDQFRDPVLALPKYYFSSSDKNSHFKIYQEQSGKFVYELFSRGGILDFRGGTNVFLSADAATATGTLDKQVDYEVDLKFSHAKIKYDILLGKLSGAVMSQFFTGFILKYQDPLQPQHLPTTLFMQIYHNNTLYPSGSYRGCYRHGDNMEIVYGNTLPSDKRINFSTENQSKQKMKFKLNQYLCDMISKGFSCDDNGKKYAFEFPAAAKNFKNWKITSMYIGLETQDTDLRPQSFSKHPQGVVEAGVQISNLKVVRYPGVDFDSSRDCGKKPGFWEKLLQ